MAQTPSPNTIKNAVPTSSKIKVDILHNLHSYLDIKRVLEITLALHHLFNFSNTSWLESSPTMRNGALIT
ncbi:hypothetical protein NTHI1209_00520 [Haemophilus influenzae]|uniref:Uncharacterized protein n=1 Tax=Haemophilus influenzae TaxID=727 RepID=A0A158SVM3_HAEIF|nr:hypothetical protein NTHI1209_00520 [Haemophilus influenzae]